MSANQPKTGARCHCKPGIERDNCPTCEGTGTRINFRAHRQSVCQSLGHQWHKRFCLRCGLPNFGGMGGV